MQLLLKSAERLLAHAAATTQPDAVQPGADGGAAAQAWQAFREHGELASAPLRQSYLNKGEMWFPETCMLAQVMQRLGVGGGEAAGAGTSAAAAGGGEAAGTSTSAAAAAAASGLAEKVRRPHDIFSALNCCLQLSMALPLCCADHL